MSIRVATFEDTQIVAEWQFRCGNQILLKN